MNIRVWLVYPPLLLPGVTSPHNKSPQSSVPIRPSTASDHLPRHTPSRDGHTSLIQAFRRSRLTATHLQQESDPLMTHLNPTRSFAHHTTTPAAASQRSSHWCLPSFPTLGRDLKGCSHSWLVGNTGSSPSSLSTQHLRE
ncbi:hypothetical protein E2C01_065484 [Portunus trituberculatus]|uniref:Uncharacterized protein n=1 Tax=Portunus trituberculatus TaxID=210409 RepID=A0A5B7HIZ0_PORTR|nr:hypothetical protein [Portunus trituberculatus]